MLPIRHILLPVDFSGRCLAMARYAHALAVRYQARLTLLHVIESPIVLPGGEFIGPAMVVDLPPNWKAEMEKALYNFGDDALHEPMVKRMVVEGDPAWQIIEMASEIGADLIVMPTHGYGTFRRFLLGSVTAKVLHDALMPVLTSAHGPDEADTVPQPVRRVLCAVDLGPHSITTLTFAAQFACDLQAKLEVAHIVESGDARLGENFGADWQEGLVRIAKDRVHGLLNEAGATAEIFVKLGDPARCIARLIESLKPDLLVIGRTPDGAGRLRSNSYGLIRASACPVLSV